MVHEIKTTEEFKALINTRTKAIVDFYGEWCPPCKRFAPTFEALSHKYTGISFYKVNVDLPEIVEIVETFDISSLPTFMIFNNGEKKGATRGANEMSVVALIESLRSM